VDALSAEAATQAGMEVEGLPAGQAGTKFIIQIPINTYQ